MYHSAGGKRKAQILPFRRVISIRLINIVDVFDVILVTYLATIASIHTHNS